jgi:hypothetical protein
MSAILGRDTKCDDIGLKIGFGNQPGEQFAPLLVDLLKCGQGSGLTLAETGKLASNGVLIHVNSFRA